MTRLLDTKLRPPALRDDRVYRPHLHEDLKTFGGGVVVVAAPAGFGKSTFVVEWLTAQQRPYAWYSVDRYDSDVVLFGEYLAAATESLTGHESGLKSLPGERTPDARTMIATLADDLAHAPAQSVLVLDDYHEIQSRDVHESVNYLVANLPDDLVVAIIARADPPLPLARMRSQGRLREVRAADLRFSSHEISEYFHQGFGVALDARDVEEIADRSEGWVAALQLASVGVEPEDLSESVATLSANHPHIASYLVDEVLDRLPSELSRFLVETSPLTRFDSQLCAEVTGSTNAAAMIEELDRQNAFLIPLGADGQWYRYHHLFAGLLHSRLRERGPKSFELLLRRAADASERRELTDDAIGYALDAGDLDLATQILDRTMESALGAGEIARLRSWLRLFPDPAPSHHTAVTFGRAWCGIFDGDSRASTEFLDRLDDLQESELDDDRRGQIAVMRAIVALQAGDAETAATHAGKGLGMMSEPHSYARCVGHLYLGRAFHAQSKRQEAKPHLERASALASTSNTLTAVSALFWLGVIEMEEGELIASERTMVRAQHIGRGVDSQSDRDPATGVADIGLAYVRLNQLDLESAIEHAERGTRLLERSTFTDMVFRAFFVWAEALSVAGRFDDASTVADEGIAWLRGRHLGRGPLETWMLMAHARNAWRRGHFGRASETLDRVRIRGLGSPNYDEAIGFYETADELALALRRHDVDEGERLLAALPEQSGGNVMFSIKRQVLDAALREVQGDTKGATSSLTRAIELASEGWRYQFSHVGPIVLPVLRRMVGRTSHDEFVRSVIERLAAEDDTPSVGPPQPLTDRELEVLAEIAAGYTNDEIADRLFISRGTVKRHASNIYLKLDAHHRAEATARARELGLID